MKKILFILLCVGFINCNQNSETMTSYVIEITTFKYKPSVDIDEFWREDAKIQDIYTSKQPGYISRESAYSKDTNEVLVVVKWRTQADAEASMKKFMGDDSVKTYTNMIDGTTMKMMRYSKK